MSEPALFAPSRNIEEVINVASRQFVKRRNSTPQPPASQVGLLNYALALIDAMYLMITTIATNLSRRISAIEDQPSPADDEPGTTASALPSFIVITALEDVSSRPSHSPHSTIQSLQSFSMPLEMAHNQLSTFQYYLKDAQGSS
jgi:hypothetical protein